MQADRCTTIIIAVEPPNFCSFADCQQLIAAEIEITLWTRVVISLADANFDVTEGEEETIRVGGTQLLNVGIGNSVLDRPIAGQMLT